MSAKEHAVSFTDLRKDAMSKTSQALTNARMQDLQQSQKIENSQKIQNKAMQIETDGAIKNLTTNMNFKNSSNDTQLRTN